MPNANYCPRCLTTFTGEPAACTNLACGHARPEEGWDHVLDAGDVLDRHYVVERCLAVGGAGLTYKARALDADGNPVPPDLAIKVLFAARDSGPFLRRLANEAQILQTLAHPNIVECHGFVSRFGQAPYLVTRFEAGGSLQDHVARVGPLPPRVAAAIAHQILTGLGVAHRAGVVHRDLKPDNVLLEAQVGAEEVPHVRVADFGIAKVGATVGDRLTRVGTFVGTPEYAAPEQFSGAVDPTPATDVFSCGGLLVFCLTGAVPVAFSHRADIPASLQELLAALPLSLPDHVGPPEVRARFEALLAEMMAPDPADRPSVEACLSRLAPLAGLAPEDAPPSGERPQRRRSSSVRAPAGPPTRRGRGAGLAVGVVVGLGALAVVIAGGLLGGAWVAGVFDGDAPPSEPGEVDLDAGGAPSVVAARSTLLGALAGLAPDLKRVCGISGEVPVALGVAADGRITEVLVRPGAGLDAAASGCLTEKLMATSLPRTLDAPVRFRTRL